MLHAHYAVTLHPINCLFISIKKYVALIKAESQLEIFRRI